MEFLEKLDAETLKERRVFSANCSLRTGFPVPGSIGQAK